MGFSGGGAAGRAAGSTALPKKGPPQCFTGLSTAGAPSLLTAPSCQLPVSNHASRAVVVPFAWPVRARRPRSVAHHIQASLGQILLELLHQPLRQASSTTRATTLVTQRLGWNWYYQYSITGDVHAILVTLCRIATVFVFCPPCYLGQHADFFKREHAPALFLRDLLICRHDTSPIPHRLPFFVL